MKTIIMILLPVCLVCTLYGQPCDLSITGGSYSPNPCNVSSTLVLNATVHNNGTQTCQNVAVGFYLSVDSLLDTGDCFLGSTTITIVPGGTVNANRNVSPLSSVPCATRGQYYVIVRDSSAFATIEACVSA